MECTCRVTVISVQSSYPKGLRVRSELSNTTDTVALVMPAWPCLYTNSCRLEALTCCKFVIPKTKQIESKMLDLPDPFKPVMALKNGSKPETTVLVAYDLNPSKQISLIYMVTTESKKFPERVDIKTLENGSGTGLWRSKPY